MISFTLFGAQKNEVRRSDLFRAENRHDFFRYEPEVKTNFVQSKSDYARPNQYLISNMDDNDNISLTTTTEASEDYLSHDTESVDRLALDGETRDPIYSSTINSYRF